MAETQFQGAGKSRQASGFTDSTTQTRTGEYKNKYTPDELLFVLRDWVIPQLHYGMAPTEPVDQFITLRNRENRDLTEARVVCQLAALALKQKHDDGMQLLSCLHARGVSQHSIYTRYLAPAARLLGDLWVKDQKDFAQVTLGTAYLQQLLREISLLWNDVSQHAGQHHRILLLPAGREQHNFGLSVLGELFRDAGWDVRGGPRIDNDELVQIVTNDQFDVVGFSVYSARHLSDLAEQIGLVKRHTRYPGVRILVGGALILQQPEIARRIPADCTPKEGEDVVALATSMVLEAAVAIT